MRFGFHDERGATAIEYAIIAGLIGLGLVGSLVTTRGSLSAVFGTASSRMASSGAAGADVQEPALSSIFAGKTYVGMTQVNPKNVTFKFSDGTEAYLGTGIANQGRDTQLFVRDPVNLTWTYMYLDELGNVTYYNRSTMKPDMNQPTEARLFTDVKLPGASAQAPYEQVVTFNAAGNVASRTNNGTITPAFAEGFRNYLADYKAFMGAAGYKLPF